MGISKAKYIQVKVYFLSKELVHLQVITLNECYKYPNTKLLIFSKAVNIITSKFTYMINNHIYVQKYEI